MQTKKKRGSVLILTYLVIVILLILGFAFVSRSIVESRAAERQRQSTQALAVAEAGFERAVYRLRQDFETHVVTPPPSWIDGAIDGIGWAPTLGNFSPFNLPAPDPGAGTGTYAVQLQSVGLTDEILIESTGTVGNISRTIEVYLKIEDISLWKNAIFAGVGSPAGTIINGNVDIRGSVLILGEGLLPTDLAIDMTGSGHIGNNYDGIPVPLSDRIPSCPTTTFGGEVVESLEATVRIKSGQVGLDGAATIGDADNPGDAYKETVDGVFVTDGYGNGGKMGAASVYSDNGPGNPYDLGGSASFPSLGDPYPNNPAITYQQNIRNNACVIQSAADLAKIANIAPNSNFTFSNANGSISMDGSGNLTISGIVYIEGGNLNMNKQGPNKTITYSGQGSILVTGDVGINVNLLTPVPVVPGTSTFPTNILGVMTPNDITFDSAQIDVMGIFYGENKITSQKQTDVAGTFASNYFDMGTNVPGIFQVPAVADNLPPGIIGSDPVWVVSVVAWQRP